MNKKAIFVMNRNLLVATMALLIAAVLSCTSDDGAPTPTPPSSPDSVEPDATPETISGELTELRRMRDDWAKFQIDSYTFEILFREPGGTGTSATIKVQAGEVTVVSGDLPNGSPQTIDELFDWAETLVSDDQSRTNVYYTQYAYPERIFFAVEGDEANTRRMAQVIKFRSAERDLLQEELDAARIKWAAAAGDEYAFEFTYWCPFCDWIRSGPTRVFISDDEIIEAYQASDQTVRREIPHYSEWIGTVEELFDRVEGAINGDVYWISATFDEKLGYPNSVSIDFDRTIIDDEAGWKLNRVFTDVDSVPAPTTAEIRYFLGQRYPDRRIIRLSTIEAWKGVTTAQKIKSNVPVCAVSPPPDAIANEFHTEFQMAAYSGLCDVSTGEAFTLTLFAPLNRPENTVSHVELHLPWITGATANVDGLRFTGNGSIDRAWHIDISEEHRSTVFTIEPTYPGRFVFKVNWFLTERNSGHVAKFYSSGSQLFYINVAPPEGE